MDDFETEVDYGRLPCPPLSRTDGYWIPKARYNAEKAELVALRAVSLRRRDALRDVLAVTRENYHTGCTCLACTAHEIARDALEEG